MKVTAKARSREDRAGDPLDGLVNLFDIGIVLSVAFLLAALSSLDLTSVITDGDKPLDQSAQVCRPTRSWPTRPKKSKRSRSSPARKWSAAASRSARSTSSKTAGRSS